MCGVVAWLISREANQADLVDRIAHRGIRTKVVEAGSGFVCHARLPIVGLGEEHDQPIVASPWTIGFVGEVLDFKETHPDLDSDVQLIPELWRYRPFDLTLPFNSRDGFWGIAAINDDTGTIHVLCDYLGQKPMYYRTDRPSAASEPAALLPMGPVTWDEVYFSAVRKWGYCPDLKRTPWAEVSHVLPGEYVRIYSNGHCVRRIVDPVVPVPMSEATLRTKIEEAVKRRVLSSDVPVAALVSGGLDSSIVYSLAIQHGPIAAHHTASSEIVDPSEEGRVERLVEPSCLEKHHAWQPVDVLRTAIAVLQEPIDLGSLVQQHHLAKFVEHRVCLTGDGADELFGGYSRSLRYDSQQSDVFQELPAWHLPRLDRVMMRRRIEVRSPFLAREVVAGALSLPWERRKDKVALREMFKDLLPDEYLQAPKVPMKTVRVEQDPDEYREHVIHTFKELFAHG